MIWLWNVRYPQLKFSPVLEKVLNVLYNIYDIPDKVMDTNDLLVGKRLQYKQVFQRALLPDQPITEKYP